MFCIICVSPTNAAKLSADRQAEILQSSLTAFDEGVAQIRDNPTAARKSFRDAITGFETLVDAGVRSVALHYNLGNAYFRADDFGRAILNYRRALAIDPGHVRAQANLDYTRARVSPNLSRSESATLWKSVAFLHYSTSESTRWWLMLAAGMIGWGALLLRAKIKQPALVATGVIGVIVASTLAGSLIWQHQDNQERPPAVVVQDDVTLRLGRGENSDPAMREALNPGVELRVLQTRAGWVEVRLANNLEGWLPESSIAKV